MLKEVVSRRRSELRLAAEKNTVRNEKGIIVAGKDDPWRDDETESDEKFDVLVSREEKLVVN